ncbi:unnamed protein product [Rhizophagus irregularis]|uniref:Uncharacterized protein n=1 Tax=Rhizophagus irregularis TaxID=588596 RepID=A0A915ZS56_9GLOM|nr:unnamed protein product [Rhizophagus irregularis]
MQCQSSCEMNLDTLKKKRKTEEAFKEYEYVYGIVTTATDWRDVEIAEIKAEVVKLAEGAQARDNNEESKQLTSRQSEVISKEMISGYDQNTIDEIEPQSSAFSNIINLASNVYEKEDVSDHTLAPSAKSSEEKETDAFLNEVDKKMIHDRIRQRNREKKLQRKNEQGLIQEINSSMKEKHILSAVTEISANQVRPNSLAERNEERAVLPDIINLYETACGAEKKAIEANREETLHWYFYAREFKRMYKDFMINNKVREKKAKDHFTEKPNMEFINDTEDEKQDDDQNNVLEVLPLNESTTPIPLAYDSAKHLNGNSSDNSKEVDPSNSLKVGNDYYKMLLED